MKQKLFFLITAVFITTFLIAQKGNEKDLTFKVRYEKTAASISPDKSWMNCGESMYITIKVKPKGRKIAKVTFKGGTVEGKDSIYTITAGSGAQGILTVYEQTADGNKIILNKTYDFKKTNLKVSCVGVKNDSVIDLMTLVALGKITVQVEETKKSVKVLNFQMIVSEDGKTDTLNSNGNALSKEMKKNIGKLKDGSVVYFYNIACQMPDMVVRKIPSMRLFITDKAKNPLQIGM